MWLWNHDRINVIDCAEREPLKSEKYILEIIAVFPFGYFFFDRLTYEIIKIRSFKFYMMKKR